MKRTILLVLLIMVLVAPCALAGEGAEAAKGIGAVVLQWALEILAPILGLIITAVAWMVLGKLGVEKSESIDRLLKSIGAQAAAIAEQKAAAYAKEKGSKMSGKDKYTLAAEKFKELADSYGLTAKIKGKVEHYVEGHLGTKKLQVK